MVKGRRTITTETCPGLSLVMAGKKTERGKCNGKTRIAANSHEADWQKIEKTIVDTTSG